MADSWLKLYLDYTKSHESPELFHFWNGIATISAAVGRKVWLDRGFYTLYPNFFVVLVAGSALCRKTTAINISTEFLEDLESVRIVDGKVGSVEKFLLDMEWKGAEDVLPPATLVKADELSIFLTRDNTGEKLMDALIGLFDCPKRFPYRTLSRGDRIIRNPCVVVVAGTQPERLGKVLTDASFGGGFPSRVIFVYQADVSPERKEMWPHITTDQRTLKELLKARIRVISDTAGEFRFTPAAIAFSREWYKSVRPPDDKRLDGFMGRKHDHVLRTAMVLRIAQQEDLIGDVKHVEAGIKALDTVESFLGSAFGDVGKAEHKDHYDRVTRTLHKAGLLGLSHTVLLKRQYGYLDGPAFRTVITTLIEQKFVLQKERQGWYHCNCDACAEEREALIKE